MANNVTDLVSGMKQESGILQVYFQPHNQLYMTFIFMKRKNIANSLFGFRKVRIIETKIKQ